jgi:Flp pilus assembly protein TadB
MMTGWQIVPHVMSPAASSSGTAVGAQGPLVAVLGVVFAALFVTVLLVAGSLHRDKAGRLLADRIERYGPRHAPATADGDGKVAGAAVGWVTTLLRSSNTERGLAHRLDLAGIGRKPAEWVLLGCCASVALAAVLTLLLGNALVGILAGALAGWLVMRLTVSTRIGRRRAAFSQQLPDVLQLIASSLQSGFSLPQAMDAVVRDDTQPAAGEFSRALAETRIGAELEDALNRAAERMDSIDLRWTVMAIRIQREVGGNLAEVLHNVVKTMRERAYLRRQVRALSAEGRLSAYVIVALPVVIGAWLFFRDPVYMRLLYTTLPGLIMLAAAVVLVVLGSLWMRALIKRVEV